MTELAHLRRDNEALRADHELLRAIFESALDAIMLADDRGTYVDANPAACRLFGLPRDQLVGRSISDFAPSRDANATFHEFRAIGRMVGLFPVVLPDGRARMLEFSAVANVVPGRHLSILRDITDRVAAEDALRRNEAMFRAVIEKSSEVISLTAPDGSTRYLTPSAWQLLGWTPEELGPHTLRDQVIPEDRVRLARELDRLVRTGARDMAIDLRVRHRDGSIRWIESSATNLLEDPDVAAIVGNYRDITARKHAEDALRESRNRLEDAQAIAHLGSWTAGLGPDDEIVWSTECYLIFGIPLGTVVTKAMFFASIHEADRGRMRDALPAMAASKQPYDLEHRVRWPDGHVRWVLSRAVIERDEAGAPLRMAGTVQDITDRRAATAALQASEERYRRIVENAAEGVWTYDAGGLTTFMNTRMAEILGTTAAQAIGQPVLAFADEADLASSHARLARRRAGVSERADIRLRRTDGTEVWVSIHANPIADADGRFEAAILLVTDITAQRHADETRARLAAIVESSQDAITSMTLDGVLTSWNAGAELLYQYRAEEMIGRPMVVLLPASEQETERSSIVRAANGGLARQYESTHVRKDGSFVEVEMTSSPVKSADGTVIGIATIAQNLTGRRQAEALHRRTEEQFRQAQKMEAVGRLAGGVAHDFNNLLSVILSYTSFALEDLKPGDPLRADINEIHEAGERGAELTKQLLAFSRQQVLQPRVIDVNTIVGAMQRMLGRLLGEDVVLTLLTGSALGHVYADPGQIEQVVMNLAVNARDAMPDGGSLSIETSEVHVDDVTTSAMQDVPQGDYILLAVTDTGGGMDATTQARIFEPFFTTKEQGKGTGLGLSTVFGIVEQSGGYIRVHSELGAGTTFKVYLPRSELRADVVVASAAKPLLRGSEVILLVEDEDQLRAVVCAALRRNGYHVLDSSNGGEAFLIARDFKAHIDLLLTDVVMPRMSGRRLAEELAPQRPDMKVLFASGYTDDAIVHHGVLDAGFAFIQKPFTPDALLLKIRGVLDRAGDRA